MPTSIAVTTARTTAMRTYSLGLGWRTVRPLEGVGEAGSRTSARSTPLLLSGRYQVHDGEDHDPHDVHEVPVQPDQLDRHRVPGRDPSGERHRHQREEHEDAHAHVGAMEPGQDVERGPEQVRGQRQALPVEGRELIDLATHECHAKQGRGQQPHPHPADLAPLDGREGQDHGERAGKQHERAHGGVRDVKHVVGVRTDEARPPIQHVARDQGPEQQAVRGEEQPHRELRVRQACTGGLVLALERVDRHRSPYSDAGSMAQPYTPASMTTAPATAIHRWKITPYPISGRPSAATNGKYDWPGRWIACPPAPWPSRPSRSDPCEGSVPAPPAGTGTTTPPSRSAYLRCHSSSSECTTGISSKLYTGGGDETDHSSVRASQGSAVASFGRRKLAMAFSRKISTLVAMMNAPIVATRFHTPSPSVAG